MYVNLFISGNASLTINNKAVEIVQQNNYPWDGVLKFNVNPNSPLAFNLMVRIPGWAQNQAIPSDLYKFASTSEKKVEIKINGQPVEYKMQNGYAVLNKTWKKDDMVEVSLPMEVRRVIANENVKDDIGKVALQRGPLIYCAEWIDNGGKAANMIIPDNAKFTTEYKPGLLNGVVILKSNIPAVVVSNDGNSVSTSNKEFIAIPYYAWAHRGKGEMMIWFPKQIKDIDLVSR